MTCEKHKIRKRKDCADCNAELGNVAVTETISNVIINEERAEEVIESIDKIEEVVINKATLEIIEDRDPIIEQEIEFIETPSAFDLDGYLDFKQKEYIKKIDDAFSVKFKEMQKQVSSLLKIKYEHIDLPLTVFNVKVMESMGKDGWKLIHILTKELAKVSGLKEDSAVLQRVVSTEWRATLDQYKEKYKGTK